MSISFLLTDLQSANQFQSGIARVRTTMVKARVDIQLLMQANPPYNGAGHLRAFLRTKDEFGLLFRLIYKI